MWMDMMTNRDFRTIFSLLILGPQYHSFRLIVGIFQIDMRMYACISAHVQINILDWQFIIFIYKIFHVNMSRHTVFLFFSVEGVNKRKSGIHLTTYSSISNLKCQSNERGIGWNEGGRKSSAHIYTIHAATSSTNKISACTARNDFINVNMKNYL